MIQPHQGYSSHQLSWCLKLRTPNQLTYSPFLKPFWWPSWDTKETAPGAAGAMEVTIPTVLLVRNMTQSFPEWRGLTVTMPSGRCVVHKEGCHTVREAACISWNDVRRQLRICHKFLQLWSASDPISYFEQVLSNRQEELRRETEIASNSRVLM